MSPVLKFLPKETTSEAEFIRVNTNAIYRAFGRKSTLIILRGNSGETRFDFGHLPQNLDKVLREYLIVQGGEVLELPAGKLAMSDAVPCQGAMKWADFNAAATATSAPRAATPVTDVPADSQPARKVQPATKAAPVTEPVYNSASNSGPTPTQPAGSRAASVIMVRASDIQPERIQWLWPNRFALGKFSLIAGNPGLGKSQLTVHIAAQVTTGGRWPNGEGPSLFGSVIILSCEDDAADTLVPRLIAAGADVSRIHIVEAIREPGGSVAQERQFDLARDVQALCRAIDEIGDVRLVIIDPITAYLGNGKNVDSHKNAEVRAALAPLQTYASKLGFAAVGVTHLNKGGGTEALMRVLGSLGFVAAARVAFLVVGDKDNERTLFIPMKNNIGVKQPGLAFRVVSKAIAGDIQTSCIEWDADEVMTTADEALAAAAGREGERGGERSSLGEAMNFLRDLLSDGPLAATEIQARAKEAGLAKATLRRAKEQLGVEARHRGDGGTGGRGEWVWEMPEQITLRRSDIYD